MIGVKIQPPKVKIPKDLFEKMGEKAMNAYSMELNEALDEEIKAVKWFWPNDTKRRNGQFIRRGLRDIVDTGALRDSKTMTRRRGKRTIGTKWVWSADYASIVLNGLGSASYPGRNWIKAAMDRLPFEQRIIRYIKNFTK